MFAVAVALAAAGSSCSKSSSSGDATGIERDEDRQEGEVVVSHIMVMSTDTEFLQVLVAEATKGPPTQMSRTSTRS